MFLYAMLDENDMLHSLADKINIPIFYLLPCLPSYIISLDIKRT